MLQNNRKTHFAIASLGAFVESLYLSIQLIGDFRENDPAISRLASAKYTFENICDYVSNIDDDYMYEYINEDMFDLAQVFDKLTGPYSEAELVELENGKYKLKGGRKLVITKELYEELKQVVGKLRYNITEVKQV